MHKGKDIIDININPYCEKHYTKKFHLTSLPKIIWLLSSGLFIADIKSTLLFFFELQLKIAQKNTVKVVHKTTEVVGEDYRLKVSVFLT